VCRRPSHDCCHNLEVYNVQHHPVQLSLQLFGFQAIATKCKPAQRHDQCHSTLQGHQGRQVLPVLRPLVQQPGSESSLTSSRMMLPPSQCLCQKVQPPLRQRAPRLPTNSRKAAPPSSRRPPLRQRVPHLPTSSRLPPC